MNKYQASGFGAASGSELGFEGTDRYRSQACAHAQAHAVPSIAGSPARPHVAVLVRPRRRLPRDRKPRRGASVLLYGLVIALIAAAPLRAQEEDLPPGVSLETRYSKLGRPLVAVRPFAFPQAVGPAADQIASVIENDLRLSDRYQIVTPPVGLSVGPVDYPAWNSLNVVYLITGEVSRAADGYALELTVHDVVYGNVKQQMTHSLPETTSPDFRLAVHAVSDEIVRAISNQPGIAATRIAFVRQNDNGTYDLMAVDSDGEELRRVWGAQQIYSPAWSPDGRKLAYATFGGDQWELIERDMSTGSPDRIVSGSLIQTPTYTPAGVLIFAMWVEGRRNPGLELHRWDGSRAHRLTSTTGDNLSPAVAPDGGRIAFHSSRLGRQHIFVMPADGGDAVLISPIGDRAQFFAPAWSPAGTEVVFHGQSRGGFHLMLADASRPGRRITQLTSQGDNQDPSWAPDGRHIVFTGVGARGAGLYVIDTVTGETRVLVRGAGLRMPDWSRPLVNGSPQGRASDGNR